MGCRGAARLYRLQMYIFREIPCKKLLTIHSYYITYDI
jgi:hypothetical protein